jgi:cbb3-type cytochrome oxidase subunit 3
VLWTLDANERKSLLTKLMSGLLILVWLWTPRNQCRAQADSSAQKQISGSLNPFDRVRQATQNAEKNQMPRFRIELSTDEYAQHEKGLDEDIANEIRRLRQIKQLNEPEDVAAEKIRAFLLKRIHQHANKFDIRVRLAERVNLSTLRTIADQVAPKERGIRDEATIYFYLPETALEDTAYARAVLNSDGIKILKAGLSELERESFLGTTLPVKGKVLGVWDASAEDSLIQLEEIDDQYHLSTFHSSGTISSVALNPVAGKKSWYSLAIGAELSSADVYKIDKGKLVILRYGTPFKSYDKLAKKRQNDDEKHRNDEAVKAEQIRLISYYDRMIALKKSLPEYSPKNARQEELDRRREALTPLYEEICALRYDVPEGKSYFSFELRAAPLQLANMANRFLYSEFRAAQGEPFMQGNSSFDFEATLAAFKKAVDYANLKGASTAMPEIRTWTDASGRYRIEAQFLRAENGNAILKRANGNETEIGLTMLSQVDQDYIAGRSKP